VPPAPFRHPGRPHRGSTIGPEALARQCDERELTQLRDEPLTYRADNLAMAQRDAAAAYREDMAQGPFGVRRRGRVALCLGAVSLVTAGCGSLASGSGATASATPSLSASPPWGKVQAGIDSDGRSVTLQVGQTLVVSLPAGWTAPAAGPAQTDTAPSLQPLRTDVARGFPVGGQSYSRFTAIRVGMAVVSANTDATCLHMTPRCAIPQQLFELHVIVHPVPGGGGGPLPKGT
jgi:hypothetical protein